MDTTEKIHSDFAGYMSPAFPSSGVHAGKPTPFQVHAGKPHPLPLPSACWEANPPALPSACWEANPTPPSQCMLGSQPPSSFPVHAGKPTPLLLPSACWEANCNSMPLVWHGLTIFKFKSL